MCEGKKCYRNIMYNLLSKNDTELAKEIGETKVPTITLNRTYPL